MTPVGRNYENNRGRKSRNTLTFFKTISLFQINAITTTIARIYSSNCTVQQIAGVCILLYEYILYFAGSTEWPG